MADITMCDGKDCPLKHTCYRFNATPNKYRQAYFAEIPYNKETNRCDWFSIDSNYEYL